MQKKTTTKVHFNNNKRLSKVMNLAAKDSSTDTARKNITLGRCFFNCKRSKGEVQVAFAERFREVA